MLRLVMFAICLILLLIFYIYQKKTEWGNNWVIFCKAGEIFVLVVITIMVVQYS